jgi:DNA polymerase-3 subunit alpha
MGITVLPPSVNESFHEFAVVPHAKDKPAQIRFGMDAIKNVGHGAVAEIIRARDDDGRFTDIGNFISRVSSRLVNRKVWESLIKAGAYDEFGERGSLLESVDAILAVGAKLTKEMKTGQTDLFGNDDSVAAPAINLQLGESTGQYSDHDFLLWERELLGLYLSKHPLEAFQVILEEKSVPLKDITAINDGKVATVGGTISEIRTIMTKNGQPMAFVKLEDFAGDEREIVVFPNAFKDYEGAWVRDKIVLVTGKVNGVDRDGTQMPEAKILADTVEILTVDEAKSYEATGKKTALKNGGRGRRAAPGTPVKSSEPTSVPQSSRLYVRVPDEGASEELQKIKKVLDGYRGDFEAVLVMGGSKQIIKLPLTVGNSPEMLAELSSIIGKEHVKFQ